MRKNQLMTTMSYASGFGAKLVLFSVGAVTLSLGVNLINVDNNLAMAATTLENYGDYTGPAGAATATNVINAEHTAGVATGAIKFASEIFGTSSSGTTLPETAKMGVRYTFDGSINAKFNATFSVDNGAKFASAPTLDCNISGDSGTGPTVAAVAGTAAGSSYKNGNTATFEIDGASINIDATSGTYACQLTYQISNAQVLATPGQKIAITASMMTAQPAYPVSPERTVTVAESASVVSVTMVTETSTTSQDDRIAVATGNTEFVNTEATTKATIGYLLVEDANRKDGSVTTPNQLSVCDYASAAAAVAPVPQSNSTDEASAIKDATGINCFNVQSVDSDKTTLTITDGQFKASVNPSGEVVLESSASGTTVSIPTPAKDESTAVFNLDADDLEALTTTTNQGTNGFAIKIVADGKTDINVNENAPVAELHIEYDGETYPDYAATTYPAVELKKIKQDGTRCVIYNVPAPGFADIVAVRITNDSGVDGIVNATLYDGSGAEIFAAQPLNGGQAVAKGATLAVFNTDLAAIGSWSGRGVLVLTTTLPSIEVLGLLREAGNDEAPLTNLSTGASGSGCTN